jgi:hypothetical protein
VAFDIVIGGDAQPDTGFNIVIGTTSGASITASVTPGTIAAPTLSCAVSIGVRPGSTLTKWQAGGLSGKWVAVIEGYQYPLTDATSAQVASAWTGTDFTAALHGLYVRLDNAQELNPWEPFTSGGSLTLQVAPDEAVLGGTFGRDTHKAAGTETLVTTSIDCDDTTLAVKSAASFSSSGTAYIGSEAVAYTGKTGTSLTGMTRGQYSPFEGGVSTRFAHMHSVATDPNGINLLPQVATHPRPEWWIGKWVGLWRHLLDAGAGLLNTRDNAQICFAGRVTEIRDNPQTGTTDVECQHVLDIVKDATIGVDPYSAKLKEGMSIQVPWRFRMRDQYGAVAWLDADDLVVVPSGASGPNEIDAGVYTVEEIHDYIRTWLAAEKVAGRLYGDYDIGLKDVAGDTRTAFYYYFEGAGDDLDFIFRLPEDVNAFFGSIPTAGLGSNAYGYHEVRIEDEPGAITGQQFLYHISLNVPLRHQHTPNGTFQLYDERNEVYDQGSSLPSNLQWWANQHGGDRGLFLIDGSLFAAVYTAASGATPATLSALYQFNPFGQAVADLNNLQLTVDDTRGPIEVRQIGAYEDSLGNIIKKLFYSTGTEGYNHATFDVLPAQLCFGGIPGELLGTPFEESVDQLPGADVVIMFLVDKPRTVADLLGGDLVLRWAYLRWYNEHLEFRTYTTPLTGTALTESNKASAGGTSDEQRSDARLLDNWQKNLIKIQYNRDFNVPNNGGYRDIAIVADRCAIDNAGRVAKSITISAANTYAQHTGSGAGIDELLPRFKSVAPLFTRPVRIISRTVDPRFYEGLAVGDVVLVSDEWARDPDTGLRGVSARPGLIVSHHYSTGGAQPGSDDPADMTGEVKILLRDVLRVAKYVPCAQVDDTATNSGLDAGTSTIFTCYAHKHSESTESADASYFTAGRKIRIIEIDPSDPAAPVSWDRIVDSQTGNTVTVTVAIGSPAWDTAKKYRIVFDDYTDALAEQQAGFTFIADDADALVADARVPYEYAIAPHLQFPYNSSYTHNAAADPVELPASAPLAEGAGLDIGHMAALNRLANNLIDYKTARSLPQVTQTEMSGAAATGTWLLCDVRPINLSPDQNSLLLYRKLYVAPHYKSTDGTSASVRISLVRKMPADDSVNDVTRDNLIADTTFTTTTSTYATPSSVGLNIGNIKDQYGNAFLLIELSIKARCMGLGYCQEGAREGGLVL